MSNPRVCGLPGPEGAESRVALQLVKGADLVRAVDNTGTRALWRKVGMIKDVEILQPQLQPESFRQVEEFGQLHVRVPGSGQTQGVFTDVAERTRGEAGSRHKRGRIEPAYTGYDHARAGIRTVRADSRYQGAPVIADPGAGDIRSLKNRDRTSGSRRENAAHFPTAEQLMQEAVRGFDGGSRQTKEPVKTCVWSKPDGP